MNSWGTNGLRCGRGVAYARRMARVVRVFHVLVSRLVEGVSTRGDPGVHRCPCTYFSVENGGSNSCPALLLPTLVCVAYWPENR